MNKSIYLFYDISWFTDNENKKSLFSKSQLYIDKTVNNNMDKEKGQMLHCTNDEA